MSPIVETVAKIIGIALVAIVAINVLVVLIKKKLNIKDKVPVFHVKLVSEEKSANLKEKAMEKKRGKYLDKFQLLNKAEQVLFSRLQEAAPALIIFSQVSMSQIFHIKNFKQSGFLQIGEIGRKSIDFLLCRQDTSMLLAIELNGPDHEKENQKISDEKKRIALEEAGIPLVTFKPENIPEVDELRKQLAPYIMERHKNETHKKEIIQAKKKQIHGTQ